MIVIFYILIVLFSVVLHEVSHGYVAYLLGDPTAKMSGRLTLNPLKHLDLFGSIILPLCLYVIKAPVIGWAKPVPYNPYNLRAGKWGPALVAVAGPLTNFSIAVFFAVVLHLGALSGVLSATALSLCLLVVELNVLLAVFNLLPIPPLDGSKVLFAVLPYHWHQVEVFLEQYGFILIVFLLFYGSNLILTIEQVLVSWLIW